MAKKYVSNKQKTRESIKLSREMGVAKYRLQGYPVDQIPDLLAKDGNINPDTGKPWSYSLIRKDYKALMDAWKDELQHDIEEHKARMLAEVQEYKQKMNENIDKHAPQIPKAWERESKLLGVDTPQKHEITGKDGESLFPDWVSVIEAANKKRSD